MDSHRSIFLRFLRFGLHAWGGPVAQIAMVRRELVEQARWVEPERFNRVMAVYQALPGPEASELCVYLGYVRRGRIGGLLAGLGFLLPGLALMLALSMLYVYVGVESTIAAGLFYGFAPAVAALVLRAVRRLSEQTLRGRWLWSIALLSAASQLAGVHFAAALLGGGVLHAVASSGRSRIALALVVLAVAGIAGAAVRQPPTDPTAVGPSRAALREPSTGEVAAAGLRAGLLTFGGAYTAIPFVERDAVREGEWLTRSQFLDGLAIASSLPAPLIIFATFVGYLGGGIDMALLMTVMVFAPAFAFTLVGHRQLERLVETPRTHALLDGVTAGVIGFMAVIAVTLTVEATPDLPAVVLLVAALAALARWSARATILVVMAGCGVAGVALQTLA